jgi:hypothetical protein
MPLPLYGGGIINEIHVLLPKIDFNTSKHISVQAIEASNIMKTILNFIANILKAVNLKHVTWWGTKNLLM